MTSPVCTVIAGPDGAGKTTFAMKYLRGAGHCGNFVNADLIAAGLSPLMPERDAVAAGRLFLREIDRYIAERKSFAFETTLSGRGYLRLIRELVANGWDVHLIYLWLPCVAACVERVAERVARSGHNIPTETIDRRYSRSVANLLREYSAVCTSTVCIDNSLADSRVIFSQHGDVRTVEDPERFDRLKETTRS